RLASPAREQCRQQEHGDDEPDRIHDEEVLVRERRGMIGERPERSDDHAEHTDCQRPEERSGRERDARGAAATRDMTQSKEEQREGDANAEEDRESCGWLGRLGLTKCPVPRFLREDERYGRAVDALDSDKTA